MSRTIGPVISTELSPVADRDPARGGPRFLKGHGTQNDFVVLPDPHAELSLTPRRVAAVCDRRGGIGADGVLRVVRAAAHPEAGAHADQAEWFMDYRNADGSVAEMCGNGIRVFARYLVDSGLAEPGELTLATRDGQRHVRVPEGDGGVSWPISVRMGRATLLDSSRVEVSAEERRWPAYGVDVGNPHAVVFVDELSDAGALRRSPRVTPPTVFPNGVNVEFVASRGSAHVAMRVHERGSGETRSCGTGACAVAVAAARRDGADPAVTGRATRYDVDLPGGRLVIEEEPDGEVTMTGPAVLVGAGELDADWWEAAEADD